MFNHLQMAPPDPILGLGEAFKQDPQAEKINLSIGVYQDANGQTTIFDSVKKAEIRLLEEETSKEYLPIAGSAEYGRAVQGIVLGQHPALAEGRVVTAHTPGGTGGLRVAADFLKKVRPEARAWHSQPTWPNHPAIFRAAGLAVETYPYFDAATNSLAFDQWLAALDKIPAGDVVLVHGCCHNPTGIDPTPAQWQTLAAKLKERGLFPLVDFAYQGLANGLEADRVGVLTLLDAGLEMLVVSSFSKNFGLYNERVGALTLVAASPQAAAVAFSHIKVCIRVNYSNPPTHGAAVVVTILTDPALRAEWEGEVRAMCQRINTMRRRLVETLKAKGVQRDFSFIEAQRGMFSFSGLTQAQAVALREKHSIYIVESGRINVAGLTEANLDRVATAMAAVLA